MRYTAENPCDEGVSIVAVLVNDVAEAEQIQLFVRTAAGDIHWEQNGHCYETAKKANSGRDFQVAEQKEAIQRLMVQHVGIGYLVKFPDPVEESIWQVGRTLPERVDFISKDRQLQPTHTRLTEGAKTLGTFLERNYASRYGAEQERRRL